MRGCVTQVGGRRSDNFNYVRTILEYEAMDALYVKRETRINKARTNAYAYLFPEERMPCQG